LNTGVFGGTFNPIHNGHLINAQLILEQYGLDRILFVPARNPVHKDIQDDVSPEDRFAMCALAIEGHPHFEASRVEIDRESPSYSVLTVRELLENDPGSDIFLIIGYDSYAEIATWRNYREILSMVHVIVMARPGEGTGAAGPDVAAGGVSFAQNPMIDISSSCIRERVRKGLPVRYLVPPSVEDYIVRKGLYRH